jgi:hypothetical protein
VLATAKSEGLFIYQPTYQQAAYLEGMVLDTVLGMYLPGAKVTVIGTANTATVKVDGTYKTGAAKAGFYDIKVEAAGYEPAFVSNVSLQNGQITQLNLYLSTPVPTSNLVKNEQIIVAPTVFNQCLSIEVAQNSLFANKETCIMMVDLNGKTVLESSFYGNKTEICTNKDIPIGQYFLYLQNEKGKSLPQRIIKS